MELNAVNARAENRSTSDGAAVVQDRGRWPVSSIPAAIWMGGMVACPMLFIIALSFATRGELGDVEWRFTWENFKRLAGYGELGFDPVFPWILARTVGLAMAGTVLCATVALPFAFFLAGLGPRWRGLGLVLVMIPFWTNLLIRTYAWQLMLAPDGPVSWLLRAVGMTSAAETLYPSQPAVWICMVCDFLPFMALPLYASVEKLDWSLVDAALDLGASRWAVFRHALLPQLRAGLSSGCLLVFLPALGQFVIPDLLGGARTVLLGSVIQQQFVQSRDWPFGAAMAVVAMTGVALTLGLVRRRETGDARRVDGWSNTGGGM